MPLHETPASALRLSAEQIFSIATGVLDMQKTDGGIRLLRITDEQRRDAGSYHRLHHPGAGLLGHSAAQ